MPVLFTAHRLRALPARTHFQINLHGVTGQKSRMSELFAAHWKRYYLPPEGTRYTMELPPSSRRQAGVHRTPAFRWFESLLPAETKRADTQAGICSFGTPEGTRTI